MPFTKLLPTSIDLAQNFTFSGTVVGAGEDNKPYFYASSDNNLSVSNNTSTNAACNVEAHDSDSKYDTSTFRFTPGVLGRYFFYVHTRVNQGSNRFQVAIHKNGSATSQSQGNIEMENFGHGSNTYVGTAGACIVQCDNVNDYFEAYVWHKEGSSINMLNRTFFGYRLAT